MTTARITLVGKPGCHLCDDARQVVQRVSAGFETSYEELSILDDETLFEEYAEEIPVVLINDRVHTIWRVDPTRLTAALQEATA
ncbi:glutaredoxin family protein [Desertivibrio insolitus]|uniref:glutaredoxin family protein n=1 Tax=Herbiconiux sp. SYSU D00978 TaxID=2812562 RepID=UPI001A95D017|nr:glutaredoxin family protein [Herbiconiux sp. SYSU D00978]